MKEAILRTLCIIIDRGGLMVKPFLGALQTTFVSALSDQNSVRGCGCGYGCVRCAFNTCGR